MVAPRLGHAARTPPARALAALALGALVVAALALGEATPLAALTPAEAERYGYSATLSRDPGLRTTEPPHVRRDRMNQDLIPAPRLPRLAPPETTIPGPATKDHPLPPPPDLVPTAKAQRLPPPPRALEIGRKFTKVGDAVCLRCHPGMDAAPQRGHLALLRNSAWFGQQPKKEPEEEAGVRSRRRRRPSSAEPTGAATSTAVGCTAGCESCHGPGSVHAETRSKAFIFSYAGQQPKEVNRVCLECHTMRRVLNPDAWHFSPHAAGRLACTSCHTNHRVAAAKMLKDRPNHLCLSCHGHVASSFAMRSRHPMKDDRGFDPFVSSVQRGKLLCVDCHDPHVRADGPSRRPKHRDGCVRCHPAQRGPFYYEHRVELDRERRCLACHAPHGSPERGLLVANGRGLCLRCHADRATHQPGQSCYAAACHADLHGSDRDLLFRRR